MTHETHCDETVESISFQKNEDDTGKPLPPTYDLQILYGAPRNLLRPESVLPCYILRPRAYKVISQDPDRISSCLVRVPQDLQNKTFTTVYEFATKGGKPVNVRKRKNDSLPDKDFISCISQWTVASMSNGIATFKWNPVTGWTTSVFSTKGRE